MCTRLCGKASWFLPFNKGNNDGAGNPPNPDGIKTDYLWKEILTKESLSNIFGELFAGGRENRSKDEQGCRRNHDFPRYHQLTVVRKLLADTLRNEVGKRYLIQHSAGERQIEFDCMAGISVGQTGEKRKKLFRFNYRGYGPCES